jgi:hypothetical protein
MLVQRSRNTNNDDVNFRELGEISGGGKAPFPRNLNLTGRNAVDVRAALTEDVHLLGVNIEAADREGFFIKEQCQGQSDISQSDDANSSCSSLEAGEELILIELGVVRLSSARNYGKGRPQ